MEKISYKDLEKVSGGGLLKILADKIRDMKYNQNLSDREIIANLNQFANSYTTEDSYRDYGFCIYRLASIVTCVTNMISYEGISDSLFDFMEGADNDGSFYNQ